MKKLLFTCMLCASTLAFSENVSSVPVDSLDYYSIESNIQLQTKLMSSVRTHNFRKTSFSATSSSETTHLINVYQNKSSTVFEFNENLKETPRVLILSGDNETPEMVGYKEKRYGDTTLLIVDTLNTKYKLYDDRKPFDGYTVAIDQ